jgi:hypothetical protein
MYIPIINESEAADISIVWLADFPKEVSKLQGSIQKLAYNLVPITIEMACLVLCEDKSNI